MKVSELVMQITAPNMISIIVSILAGSPPA